MKIITGRTGQAHVTSGDDRSLNAATFGSGQYVLNSGSKFNVTIETSNNIVLADGDLVINGTHARIPFGETETVNIENGSTGYKRIDLVVARYTISGDIEDVQLVVLKGTPTTGTPTQPAHNKGNVLEGAEIVDMPLYAIKLNGVNIESVTPMFTIATGFDDVYKKNQVYRKEEVDAMRTALNEALTNKINNLSSRVDEIEANASSARENLEEEMNGLFNPLESRISSLEQDFSGQINLINSQINAINKEISNINNKIATLL